MDQLGCKKKSDAVGFEKISQNICQKAGIMSGSKNVEGKKESQDHLTSREAQQLNSAQMSLVKEFPLNEAQIELGCNGYGNGRSRSSDRKGDISGAWTPAPQTAIKIISWNV
ncbi:hypothetical protein WN944_014753 [Citrus x changshan-huyou]|uniref:Uncharacterized protein n=1 Tax=Citrus x changshan-huyou TaxID=2935761 RepID=A0AAP0M692_9ROSI